MPLFVGNLALCYKKHLRGLIVAKKMYTHANCDFVSGLTVLI